MSRPENYAYLLRRINKVVFHYIENGQYRTYTINGNFSTYVTDSTKPNNRRKIVKASKELLEKEIVKFYKEREKKKSREKICLKTFYAEWLDFKALHTNSCRYIKTIDELWKRYYAHNGIIEIPFSRLDKYTLDIWAHSMIKDNSMTKKQYYNMAIIMRQALELATEKTSYQRIHFQK